MKKIMVVRICCNCNEMNMKCKRIICDWIKWHHFQIRKIRKTKKENENDKTQNFIALTKSKSNANANLLFFFCYFLKKKLHQ